MPVNLQFSGSLSKSDPESIPVVIVGQTKNLAKISYDDVKVKLQPRVSAEVITWQRSLMMMSRSSCSLEYLQRWLGVIPGSKISTRVVAFATIFMTGRPKFGPLIVQMASTTYVCVDMFVCQFLCPRHKMARGQLVFALSVILSFRPIKVCLLNSSYILAWIWMKLGTDVVTQV